MTITDKLDRLAEIARASAPDVREQIIQIAMNMCLPLSTIESCVAKMARGGHVYVGVLPPPKGKAADDHNQRRQLLFRSTANGDDMDRSLTRYEVDLPAEVLEIYLAHLRTAEAFDPREIPYLNGGV